MKETLEQTAAKFAPVEIGNESHNRGRDENSFAREAFITGAKWQQEKLLEFINDEDNHTEGELGNSCIDIQSLLNFIGQEVGHSVQVDVIDLIQFLSMNQEFNGYSSVSKETAKYFLEQFKKQ